ncbi:hypothetical protein JTB14_000607 [Gonioctena quinquepunctata]|nr:hypothetical protein JTB14_000607 [Gonioctena quinquepunctata]
MVENSHDEQLMEKVCNKVVSRFEQILDKKFAEMEKRLSEMTMAIETNKQMFMETKKSVITLELQQDDTEQMRKYNLRINGLTQREGEDILDTVLKFVRDNLNVKCVASDIDEVYKLNNLNRPNETVMVKFVSNIKKYEVLKAKKMLKELQIGNISLFDDLTNKRYQLFRLAQRKYGKKSVWTMDGKIYRQTEKS